MPLAKINGKLLHFVHIPKTGGSSVTSYLRAKGDVGMYSRRPIGWSRTTPQHMEYQTSKVLVPDGFSDATFTVLRDPLQRLVSEFRYRATRYNSTVGNNKQRYSGGALTVELDWNETYSGTFEEWIDVVFEKYQRDPYTCDNHIRPQTDFIGRNITAFLLEDGLEQVFRWIDNITGTKRQVTTLDSNRSANIGVQVSDRTRTIVKEFYSLDYEFISEIRDKRWSGTEIVT